MRSAISSDFSSDSRRKTHRNEFIRFCHYRRDSTGISPHHLESRGGPCAGPGPGLRPGVRGRWRPTRCAVVPKPGPGRPRGLPEPRRPDPRGPTCTGCPGRPTGLLQVARPAQERPARGDPGWIARGPTGSPAGPGRPCPRTRVRPGCGPRVFGSWAVKEIGSGIQDFVRNRNLPRNLKG